MSHDSQLLTVQQKELPSLQYSIGRHIIFLWLKTGTLQKNKPYQINVVQILLSMSLFGIPVVEAPRKTKMMHFTKKQNNV